MQNYQVRAVHCDHLASDEEVYLALKRATAPLSRSWERLKKVRRIWVKFNQDWRTEPRILAGNRQELVSDSVARAVLRLLRENTSAELLCAEVSFFQAYSDMKLEETTWLKHVLEELEVPYIDWNHQPIVPRSVPGGGLMFRHYFLPECLREDDALVSVQKLKNHAYMGVTLCLKNLFGIMPTDPHGRPRHYYHHLVRMPYMLADIGRIFNPALNILDALVSQAGREWGGDGRITNTLIAGDHPIATDACATYLMGHDPNSDWLTPPFHRDRNALRVAAENGFGTVNLTEIDFESEVQAPLGEFFNQITDPLERVISWRLTTAEQALYYRDHQSQFLDKYSGEYILLQEGEVRWHDRSGRLKTSRRFLAGSGQDEAMWFKYVDPQEFEGENFAIYEQTLEQIKALKTP